MSDPEPPPSPELVVVPNAGGDGSEAGAPAVESVAEPAKVMRIGAMVKELLEEVRRAPLDEAGRRRLREIHETSVHELAEGLSPDLQEELARFSLPFDESAPTEAELRIAQAQLEELNRRGLPPGARPEAGGERPGTYL